MSLIAHLDSLFPHQITDIKNLIDRAKVETAFLGSRVVTVDGFTGSVDIDDIATRILEVSKVRFKAADSTPLSTEERIAGVDIVKKLNEFYIISDNDIKNCNFFTRLLNWILEFSTTPTSQYYPPGFFCTARFTLAFNAENNFLAYSEARFLEQFGGAFNYGTHPDAEDTLLPGFPMKILAKEDSVRNLLLMG